MVATRNLLTPRLLLGVIVLALLTSMLAISVTTRVLAQEHDETDPARNLPLPCEVVSTDTPPRTARNIEHVANICGIVGTDVEFQSRESEDGLHDYAFVGTMGGGFRIFDITDPESPDPAGGYIDTGWQNDIQVRGDIAVSTFDGVSGEPSAASTCLLLNYPTAFQQGVDIFRLTYNGPDAQPDFTVNLLGCVANPPGGTHNSTLHPSGDWLMLSNSSSDWAVDFIDIRGLMDDDPETGAVHRFRLIDESRWNVFSTTPPGQRCPEGADFACIVLTRPEAPALGSDPETAPCGGPTPVDCPPESPYGDDSASGLFRPHDIFFSEDGFTMYVAALPSTTIVDIEPLVTETLTPTPNDGETPPDPYRAMTIIPNLVCPTSEYGVPGVDPVTCAEEVEDATGLENPHNLQLSHQADTTSDGLILTISDERGGGTSETRCNEDPAGVIGGLHSWALGDIGTVNGIDTSAATPTNPVRLGAYFNPNPGLGVDPFQEDVEDLPRSERACTSHVFRYGGNGTMSPGAGGNLDGVSRLPERQMTLAWYGAGVWWLDMSGPTDHEEESTPEEPRSTWGNTLGWNVMPGSEMWSGKTYKPVVEGADPTVQAEGDSTMYIYGGDIVRGFDIYRFSVGFVQEPVPPTPTPGPTGTTVPTGTAGLSPGPSGSTPPPAGATTRPPSGGGTIPDTASDGGARIVVVASALVVLLSLGSLVVGSRGRRGPVT